MEEQRCHVNVCVGGQELQLTKPEVCFTECVEDWQPGIIADYLPSHQHFTCIVDLKVMCDKYSRPRRLTTSLGSQVSLVLCI